MFYCIRKINTYLISVSALWTLRRDLSIHAGNLIDRHGPFRCSVRLRIHVKQCNSKECPLALDLSHNIIKITLYIKIGDDSLFHSFHDSYTHTHTYIYTYIYIYIYIHTYTNIHIQTCTFPQLISVASCSAWSSL